MNPENRRNIHKQASKLYHRFEKAARSYFYYGLRYLRIPEEALDRMPDEAAPVVLRGNPDAADNCRRAFGPIVMGVLLCLEVVDFIPIDHEAIPAKMLLIWSPFVGRKGYDTLVDAAASNGVGQEEIDKLVEDAKFVCEFLEDEVEGLRDDLVAIEAMTYLPEEDPFSTIDSNPPNCERMRPWMEIKDQFLALRFPGIPAGEVAPH